MNPSPLSPHPCAAVLLRSCLAARVVVRRPIGLLARIPRTHWIVCIGVFVLLSDVVHAQEPPAEIAATTIEPTETEEPAVPSASPESTADPTEQAVDPPETAAASQTSASQAGDVSPDHVRPEDDGGSSAAPVPTPGPPPAISPAEPDLGALLHLEKASMPGTEPVPVPEDSTPAMARLAGFNLSVDGFLRSEFGSFLPDRFLFVDFGGDSRANRNPFVGRSDGFALAAARINLRGRRGQWAFRLAADGAAQTFRDSDDTLGDFSGAGLKDAFIARDGLLGHRLTLGRFKPPFDAEGRTPVEAQWFVHRALESRGVERHEGPSADMPGFAPGRQLGVMISRMRPATSNQPMEFAYAVALTNGNRRARNDNDLPALTLRAQLGYRFAGPDPVGKDGSPRPSAPRAASEPWDGSTYQPGSGVDVGLSLMANRETFGSPPGRQGQTLLAAAMDLSVAVSVFRLQGQAIVVRRAFTAVTGGAGQATDLGLGGHAQAGVSIPATGLVASYRFALYDPRVPQGEVQSAGPGDNDLVSHHTIGLRWRSGASPLAAYVEFTRSVEQPGRAIPNDRLELALHFDFY